MKIGVLVKQVPDTATKIRISDDGKSVSIVDVKWIVNPYDEFAVEEALKLKATMGQGEVVVISLGPKRCQEALRTALAMGADRAIHLEDEAFEGSDILGLARIFNAVIRQENFNIVFAGKMAVDDDQGQLPQALAELLDWPHVQPIVQFAIAADRQSVTVQRMVGGGTKEVIEVPLPAVFGCEKGLNEPRYASLPGIMKAKSKPLQTLNLTAVALQANQVGKAGAKLVIEKMAVPAERPSGKMLKGETEEVVKQLVDLLRNEAKVI